MTAKGLEGQLGFCLFCGGQSIWLKVGELQTLGNIDSETKLFVRMNEIGILEFSIGKRISDDPSLYS